MKFVALKAALKEMVAKEIQNQRTALEKQRHAKLEELQKALQEAFPRCNLKENMFAVLVLRTENLEIHFTRLARSRVAEYKGWRAFCTRTQLGIELEPPWWKPACFRVGG
ncbi:hypothetical protein PsorP6_011909 [Peronosclerospora sorghi]|uniref:Uncharacterized protein n=1 Tax=Peronosclerospora sorghi TaxID=230839 RepID=A0ACC0WHV4_9STRA|nr:hypothetical protein PsorP6_011909 [Peronosclerospora sorghi]